MLPQETYFMSVRALGDAIREGRLSPVELTEGTSNAAERSARA
jgi:hypothetical protein